jgi:anti-sigma regulatory factor (Ser/Thr protein kinase)/DNA-directed RNA polymerase subunit RPC12/RpoP
MPFYSCPNCGSSISDAVETKPTACPWCCARIRVEDDVPAAAHLAAHRPRPVLRMPLGMDPLAPWAARHAIETLRLELGEARYRVCELLVSELVNNVVSHTGDGSRITASDMRVRVYPDRVRIEVRDQGPGFEPTVRDLGDDDPESGWGLFLVDELADDWGVESGVQNCVWFELARTPLSSGLHAAAHH